MNIPDLRHASAYSLPKADAFSFTIYFKAELKTRSSNPQKVWELIKTTLPSPQNLDSPTTLLISGDVEDDLVAITNEFNNFFSSIGKKLA